MADVMGWRLGGGIGITVLNSTTFNTQILDATTDQAEWIFQARQAATITKLGFRVGVRAGTPPTYRISLQGVGTDGNPSGTIKGGGSPASKTFTPPADTSWDGTWQWFTLDNSYVCTRGEFLAIVIDYSSGTIAAGNSITVTTSYAQLDGRACFPYGIQNNAGTRTRNSDMPVYGYASASMVYGFPLQAATQTQFSSDSTPDEYAGKFNIPTTLWSTFKISGVSFMGRTAAAAKSSKGILYAGTTLLQDVTMDSDFAPQQNSQHRHIEYLFDETTLSTLSAGTDYYIALQPQDTAANFAVLTLDFANAGDLDALPGGAAMMPLATRTDAGAWTVSTTKRILLELIVDDITAPSGGSGALMLSTGMDGGCN